MALKHAAMIGSGVALRTPMSDGSPNQALVTNGSGALSFATISSGVTSLNALTGALSIAVGTSGTDFAVSAAGSTITLDLPSASTTARGVVSTGTQGFIGQKTFNASVAADVPLSVKLVTSHSGNAFEVNSVSGSGGNLFKIAASGAITSASSITGGQITVGSADWLAWTGRAAMQSPSNGVLTMHVNAGASDFNRLQFGGTSASFPSIKRSSATLQFRLADDSDDCAVTMTGATLRGLSSTPVIRERADWTTAAIDNTDATRKYRSVHQAYDTASREYLRGWGDGSVGRIACAAPASAPTDAHLAASQISFYLDEAGHNLLVRVKYADGTTLKLATIALA